MQALDFEPHDDAWNVHLLLDAIKPNGKQLLWLMDADDKIKLDALRELFKDSDYKHVLSSDDIARLANLAKFCLAWEFYQRHLPRLCELARRARQLDISETFARNLP